MSKAITIDVVSDVICPWCFLGKRRLAAALGRLDDVEATIRWRPFMLDSSIPPEGLDRTQYLTAKFGAERVRTIHDPLIAAGAELGGALPVRRHHPHTEHARCASPHPLGPYCRRAA